MRKPAVLLFVLLIAPTATFGVETHLYLGGTVGEKVVIPESSQYDIDVDGQPFKLFGGLGLGDHIGFELAYHDFATQVCCSDVDDFGFSFDFTGISTAVVAKLPVRRFGFFAKLGYLWWDMDGEGTTNGNTESSSGDGDDLMAGAGATFNITRQWAARLEWETFKFEEENVDAFSAGFQFRF